MSNRIKDVTNDSINHSNNENVNESVKDSSSSSDATGRKVYDSEAVRQLIASEEGLPKDERGFPLYDAYYEAHGETLGAVPELVLNQTAIEQLVEHRTGIDDQMVKQVVDAFWDEIGHQMMLGNVVKLHGKGKFYLSERASRIGRNPATGTTYEIPTREVMVFQVSPTYARRVREERESVVPEKGGDGE